MRALLQLLFISALVLGLPAAAKITPWSLNRFVNSSVLVIVAKVERVEPTGLRDQGFEELKVRVAIERVLKGYAESEAAFFTLRSAPEFPRFEAGQRCLLFISHFDGKLWITQGANGKIVIDGEAARDVYMIDEPETQSLGGLIMKIERAIARGAVQR